jgi:putative ABC transport system permease protein
VKNADFLRYKSIAYKDDAPPVTLIARPLREDVLQSLTLVRRAKKNVLEDANLPAIWVTEAMLDLYGFEAGSIVTIPVDGLARKMMVAGIWRDYARSYGAITMDRDAYIAMTGDTKINDVAITLKPDANKTDVINAIRALPNGDRLDIVDADEIRKLSLSAFDRSFAVTYALEIAAIFVGLAGISATFSAQAWSRRREFGMLRHLGITRREIRKLLSMEGALLGAIGAAIGLVLGFAIALVLIFVVNRQSFHWSMELHIPWLVLAILSALLVALTALSAVISGRFAMSRQAVMAVREDA